MGCFAYMGAERYIHTDNIHMYTNTHTHTHLHTHMHAHTTMHYMYTYAQILFTLSEYVGLLYYEV